MKATYLGHACYAIRCAKRLILIDPLLTDVFQDGTAEVWPRRHIDLAAMPRPDVIVITHSHPGHLEVPSLALLPRSVPVFYPADPTIELVLEELGFATRTVVGPGDEIELDGATITMTGSTSGYPELGCLIQEGAASVWYLADTAVGPRDLQRVAERAERVDLLLGNYPGYHHKFFTLLDVSFPHAELERALSTVLAVRPTLLAANFTGLRYLGDGAWINRFMFPMDAAAFLDEVHALEPSQQVVDLKPGDEIEVIAHAVPCVRRAAAAWVRCDADVNSGELRFDPSQELPRLRDPDPEQLGREVLAARIAALLRDELRPWIEAERRRPGTLCAHYAQLGITMRVHVVYPEGADESWLVAPGEAEVRITREPDDGARPATHLGLRIAASVLDRWRRAEIPYYQVYLWARPYGSAYRTGRLRDERVAVEAIETRDLLAIYFGSDVARVYHPWLRRELRRYGDAR